MEGTLIEWKEHRWNGRKGQQQNGRKGTLMEWKEHRQDGRNIDRMEGKEHRQDGRNIDRMEGKKYFWQVRKGIQQEKRKATTINYQQARNKNISKIRKEN